MTEDEFYTYPASYETTVSPTDGGGIRVDQSIEYGEANYICLTVDQARWLSQRLSTLVDQIVSGEFFEQDKCDGNADAMRSHTEGNADV